ncbi:methyl-CpG-binding domain-containing protein 9-like isoform X2 [Phoenix dactylifera]|uniref:Methyl-CpG-binding domain-containing protein 9-like isoform X2 n=1 Tax=Phoenix dactylifera TaxID=42345 RepID=A0A8B9A7L8_PHODC|nr:methyl-CpG-binding domain-containing protein 9-like isoform X2 [Phoenix dactylifera]
MDPRPAPLSIDLNEFPPPHCDTPPAAPAPPFLPYDAYALACRFHGNIAPAAGLPAEFPGEAGIGRPFPCGICGRPETRSGTVVCDGCERGFHLSCARVRVRQHVAFEDWVCTDCTISGVPNKRWALGAARLLDINAPPPSEGDGEASTPEELHIGRNAGLSRKNNPDGASFSGFGVSFPQQNVGPNRNAFDLVKDTETVTDDMKISSEGLPYHGLFANRGFENPVSSSSLIGRSAVSNATVSGQSQGEMFLQFLRNFIMEKGGFLGEGWSVEFKEFTNKSCPYAVYCSPDGKRFESMSDVAQYLGIKSSFPSMDIDEISDGSGIAQRSLTFGRRKKDLARNSMITSSNENQDSVWVSCGMEPSSDTEVMEPQFSDVRSASRVAKTFMEENCGNGSQDASVGLPVQYEDFFVVSLGKIDLRMTYHDNYQIWPVGYKSHWHDKVTGSLFECEVSDGGNAGPVFKVRRRPCLISPIPSGATVLLHKNVNKDDMPERMEIFRMTVDADCDNDDDILMLLSVPDQSQQDLLSCFSSNLGETSYESSVQINMQKPTVLTPDLNCHSGRSSDASRMRDEIGEFYVEGRSSQSVWKMVSHTLLDACREVYKQSGCLQFCCGHNSRKLSSYSGNRTLEALDHLVPLAKFCCFHGPIATSRIIQNDSELEATCKSLAEWLSHDRFGLDVGFVQEIIESLPGSHACSHYQFLNDRTDFSTSWTVASGLLLAIEKNGEQGEEVASCGLYRGHTKSRLKDIAEDSQSRDHQTPPGKPVSSRLPAELVGDVLQIWELLWRFYEILGLKEPPSFEELEEELIDPWPMGSYNLENLEKEIQNSNNSANGPTSFSTGESGPTAHEQSPFIFMPIETASAREAARARLASRTYGRCNGVVLTKTHIALLKVLVGELLCKVAGFVDPNFDARESKPRRGRKKDMDNSLPAKETKIEMLTINELTWPELARRYILAVSSMNGCMDSPDAYSREGMKLYRCLQGDGGVLCGSLFGVAGMEADALLLAEAERQISGNTKRDNEVFPVDSKDSDGAIIASEPAVVSSNSLPEWAQPLEPVKKLPTNVGTRIRKCIYDSLDKNPPEWAKKILEHSISKEVYRGNASGPTKKAVLSVLAEASGGGLKRKIKGRKEKSPISLSDVIMKKCRTVLRRSVSADEAKVFCNLLGAALTNSNDNEDEGILGFPAMVSRPLDFRAIDLRLAVGAYGGSHEAFLEDVREVWHNICTAYGDRPDLMQLAKTLSQKFESLYEKEVLNLAQKFLDHAGAEHFDSETWKELHDVLLTANELPKAPWEEGVCKVCGIDKDDDSVLLCDKCDSEYHMYCLNPPLARIPEGNWYCPSCVHSQSKMQDSRTHSHFIKRHPRRHLGEESRAFQDALNQLAITIEEREYWEFNIEERIFLLKFLCDEVLNTAFIREHLEQCADKSNDLQQKLRNLGVELRNLKSREELLAMRAVKESTSKFSAIGDVPMEEDTTALCASHGSLMGQQQNFSNKMNYIATGSSNPLKGASITMEDCLEENGQGAVSKNTDHFLRSITDTNAHAKKTQKLTSDGPALNTTSVPGNSSSSMNVSKGDPFNGQDEKSVIFSSQRESDEAGREVATNIVNIERHTLVPSKTDTTHGSHQFSDSGRTDIEENTHSVLMGSVVNILAGELPASNQDRTLQGSHDNIHANVTEPECINLEMDSLKNEISDMQDSIASLESQLMMTSIRREYLGRDSSGRLYWVLGRPGKHPLLVADGSMPVPHERRDMYPSGSHSCSPSDSNLHKCWDLFESDHEIQELVCWLRDTDPRERELKECILQWLRLLMYQDMNHAPDDFQQISKSSICENSAAPHCLSTKAEMILGSRYGPFLEPEVSEIPKKRGRKAKISHEERMYRCECLEPVWSSRHHCLSCHQTFCAVTEIEGHSDGKCTPSNPASDESKEGDDQLKGKGARSESIKEKENSDDVDIVETSKKQKLDICSRLVKFPRKVCPYDLDEISKKFITKNSNKEVVKEVGLLGSNGVPSFVPSPVFFLDPVLVLNQSKKSDTGLALSEEWLPMSIQREEAGANASQDDIRNGTERATKSAQNCVGNGSDDQLAKSKGSASDYTGDGECTPSLTTNTHGLEVPCSCTIPESSLRPLVGKISQILKQLKINLLDMDAALPEEALRPSKSHLMKRCAWRAFVKSAESIFEATILFEGMIKTEYLKNSWWFWSSLTAAAKTPTISSLALRIYTLDDSVIYTKELLPSPDPTDSLKMTSKLGKKRKDVEVGS